MTQVIPAIGNNKAPATIPALNLARWTMAGLVVIGHVRDLIFRDAIQVAQLSVPWKVLYFLTGFGHAAVVVFFVLSGFFVGGKLLDKKEVDDVAVRRYLIDRTSRIYIVLGPALLLTALLDSAGTMLSPIYHSVGWSASLPQPAAAALDFKNLFACFFNLTMYVGAPLGSNGPLWSLAFEWLIYLMFPWLLVDLRRLCSGRYGPGMIGHAVIGTALLIGSRRSACGSSSGCWASERIGTFTLRRGGTPYRKLWL